MNKREILDRIDHTELRPNASIEDYARLSEEAKLYRVPAVCVPPNVVLRMRKTLPDAIHVCTVVGFPLGYSTIETKIFEARQAIANGADEIDMVIDISKAIEAPNSAEGWLTVQDEIERIREVCCDDIILKVIIETCYLNTAQKIALCGLVTSAKADFIKTSTGFGPKGAEVDDIYLFRKYLGSDVKIKAAGGISTIAAAKDFITAGCERIGSSKLVRLLAEAEGDEV